MVGRELDFRLLSALNEEIIEASLLELVNEALAAHVIEELPEARERYQFSHALIQETLSEESSTSRRVRLHARPSNGFTCHLPPLVALERQIQRTISDHHGGVSAHPAARDTAGRD